MDEWASDTPQVPVSTYRDRIAWGLQHDRLTRAQATWAMGEPLDPIIPGDVHAALDTYGIPRVV